MINAMLAIVKQVVLLFRDNIFSILNADYLFCRLCTFTEFRPFFLYLVIDENYLSLRLTRCNYECYSKK